jgi:hypothetical protein
VRSLIEELKATVERLKQNNEPSSSEEVILPLKVLSNEN